MIAVREIYNICEEIGFEVYFVNHNRDVIVYYPDEHFICLRTTNGFFMSIMISLINNSRMVFDRKTIMFEDIEPDSFRKMMTEKYNNFIHQNKILNYKRKLCRIKKDFT